MISYKTLQDDIRNAGGLWVDEEVVVDGNLITSRMPDDRPAFNDQLIRALACSLAGRGLANTSTYCSTQASVQGRQAHGFFSTSLGAFAGPWGST